MVVPATALGLPLKPSDKGKRTVDGDLHLPRATLAMESSSFASRRQAAGNLPHFHLPPPNPAVDVQVPSMPVFPPSPPYRMASRNPASPTKHITDNRSGVTGTDGLSPLSSSVNSGSSQSSQAGGIAPYNPSNNWAIPASSSYTYNSLNHSQPSLMTANYGRSVYPPSSNNTYNARSSHSPATGEGMAAPPYDNVSPPFPLPHVTGASTPSQPSLLSQSSHHSQSLQNPILSSQSPAPQASSQAVPATSDGYGRGPPTPAFYAAATSTPQPPSFPSFAPHTPGSHHSPTTSGHASRGIPALASHQPSHMSAPHHYGSRPYAYPSMGSNMGTVLSNINPGGQMTLVSGMSQMPPGYPTHHHMGHHMTSYGQPQAQNDRPFKCDVCPQSFNRNHDLKRHKRIHLAVKPFPCNDCDKSFSRKDALKVGHTPKDLAWYVSC